MYRGEYPVQFLAGFNEIFYERVFVGEKGDDQVLTAFVFRVLESESFFFFDLKKPLKIQIEV